MQTRNINSLFFASLFLAFLSMIGVAGAAQAAAPNSGASLQALKIYPLPENRVKISLTFSSKVKAKPRSFTTKQPARIIVDLPGVKDLLKDKDKNQTVDLGILRQLATVQAENRTRLILDLRQLVSYSTEVVGNRINITLAGPRVATRQRQAERFVSTAAKRTKHRITAVDFRANPKKGGRIIVDVSDPNIGIDIKQRGKSILVNFLNTSVSRRLLRRLDVSDFATPVQTVDTLKRGRAVELKIASKGDFEHFAYQVDKKFIIDITPMTPEAKARAKLKKELYTGKRISLNFQNIKVRAVLQLLAEFTGTNMVVSDTVNGDITLRLNNVPWDQALAIILKTRGLDKRKMGSVLLIAPANEISAREKAELEAQKQVEELAPLRSELIQINYAKAGDLASLLKEKGNSLLSPRGNVSVDARTNTLWVQDTGQQLEEIRSLVHKLDIPVRQVLIEARVVMVDRDFEQELGVRFGVTKANHLSGTLEGANELAGLTPVTDIPVANRLNLDLPAIPAAGTPATLGIAVAKLGNDVLLDLELSALESEGRGQVISSPRLITANQQPALIESGEEIPYQEATSSGATATSFKKAVLSLQVTPQITPDDKIILALQVNQDTPSAQRFNGVPAILTKEIRTNVLVDNGQTVVLGGIYKQTNNSDIRRVPFLGSLPVVGYLFRSKSTTSQREELLIFVTPKIIQQSYTSNS